VKTKKKDPFKTEVVGAMKSLAPSEKKIVRMMCGIYYSVHAPYEIMQKLKIDHYELHQRQMKILKKVGAKKWNLFLKYMYRENKNANKNKGIETSCRAQLRGSNVSY